MQRPSPPTRRVLGVLEAFGTAPAGSLTLSAVTRRTGISKATCLGILNELCAAQWLVRDAEHLYRLGPGALRTGAAAAAGRAAVDAARGDLARLAASIGGACTASAVVGDSIAILARVGDPTVAAGVTSGSTYPLAPPSGVMFVAWDSDEAVQRWLARPPLAGVPVAPGGLWAVVAACRRRGYLVEEQGEVNTELYALLSQLDADVTTQRYASALSRALSPSRLQHYLLDDPGPGVEVRVSQLCAPVYSAAGVLDFLVGAFLMRPLDARQLGEVAGEVLATTRALTAAGGGLDAWAAAAPGSAAQTGMEIPIPPRVCAP